MNCESQNSVAAPASAPAKAVSVKIFGVGTAGVHLIEQMRDADFAGATFVAVNTEAAALAATTIPDTLYLQTKLLRGLGTGGDPERGRVAAEEYREKLKDACRGVDVVFIVTALGGGAGSGISPVLAAAAKEAGALVLGFVTVPFDCEGNRRQYQALVGLEQLKDAADGVLCLPCQKVFKLIGENTGVVEMFKGVSEWLIEGVRGVWRLLAHKGLIQIHFADLVGLLRDRHAESCFAAVEAAGETRSRDAVEKLLAHPLLDAGKALTEADAVLVSLMGGPDLAMAEINRVMEQITEQCGRAQIIVGAAVNEAFRHRLSVTLIATGRGRHATPKSPSVRLDGETTTGSETPDFDTELLHGSETKRPPSRLVPPTPTLTTEQREEIIAKHAAKSTTSRKKAPRMRQTQLPLEIVTKGRFDRTEPTVYKGEDLDLPTYVRRGISLN